MTTMERFADDVLTTLQQHLAPGEVTFRGSLRWGDVDRELISRLRNEAPAGPS